MVISCLMHATRGLSRSPSSWRACLRWFPNQSSRLLPLSNAVRLCLTEGAKFTPRLCRLMCGRSATFRATFNWSGATPHLVKIEGRSPRSKTRLPEGHRPSAHRAAKPRRDPCGRAAMRYSPRARPPTSTLPFLRGAGCHLLNQRRQQS